MKLFPHLRMSALAVMAALTALYPAATVAAAVAKVVDLRLWLTSGHQQVSLALLGSNTLTNLIPTIYAALDVVAREFVGFLPNVLRNSDVSRAAVGQTITAPVAPPATASDITPGVTAPNDGDQVFTNYTVSMTKARYVPIRWNGEEQLGLNNGGPGARAMIVQQFAQAFRTLTNEMEQDMILTAYKAASRATGTAGTAPFGTAGDLTDFSNAAQILDVNGAPIGGRFMIVNAAAMNNIRGKQSVLFKVNEAGTDELLRRGTIGEAEGFSIGYAPAIKQVVKGAGTGYLLNGAAVVGQTALVVDTGSGTVLPGDCITIAGDTNVYVVKSGGSGSVVLITINNPGLLQASADNAAITIGNSFTPNIAFQANGLLLATRLPAAPVDINGVAQDMADDRTTITDPFSNISFEIALYRQYRQIKYEIGLVWGQAGIKSDFITTVRG